MHKVTYIRALLIQPRMEHFLTLRAGLGASSSRALLVKRSGDVVKRTHAPSLAVRTAILSPPSSIARTSSAPTMPLADPPRYPALRLHHRHLHLPVMHLSMWQMHPHLLLHLEQPRRPHRPLPPLKPERKHRSLLLQVAQRVALLHLLWSLDSWYGVFVSEGRKERTMGVEREWSRDKTSYLSVG